MAYRRLNNAASRHSGVTFNDMILQKMASDRRPILQIFADKWSVRNYVERCIGEKYLPIVHFYSDSYLRSFPLGLPSEYALKATHCSGASVLVWHGAKKECSLPRALKVKKDLNQYRLHPDSVDKNRLLNLANSWLDIDYSWRPEMLFPEWAYDGITRGFIFEELLLDEGEIPQDFKFFVFNGRVELIRVNTPDKNGKKSMAHFNLSWVPYDLEFRVGRREKYASPNSIMKAPENLTEMVAIAQRLSVGMDFLRVDLYSIKSKIYFGELTNYPSAGKGTFYPNSFNSTMGNFFRPLG